MYINDSVEYNTNGVECFNLSNEDIELLWINVILKHTRPIRIGLVYRPPNSNCSKAINILENTLNSLPNSEYFAL